MKETIHIEDSTGRKVTAVLIGDVFTIAGKLFMFMGMDDLIETAKTQL